MGDPGFISGMIGCAIQVAANQIIQCINVAIRCRKELDALKILLLKIQLLNMEMQEYRKALNSGRTGTSPHRSLPSTVNSWLNELNSLLEEASDLASEDKVIPTEIATKYWIGEGLVTGPNPVQTGEIFVNLLADRCLIEPLQKDHNGKLINFRVHDLLHDLAHQIAEKEEKCFFQACRGLGKFPADNCGGNVRISLMDNGLTRVPKAFGAPYIRTLLLPCDTSLTAIPNEVIGRMTALRVLDLSRTALHSLPKNMGCLKHLVCRSLRSVPIKKLPSSVAALGNLQILDLCGSDITQLPSRISKLTSLKLLDVSSCEHLQCMPCGISQLTSLEYLDANNSPNIGWNECRRDWLSINDLGTLSQLKRLGLETNSERIRGGILGTMKQMESLHLSLEDMESLPQDMAAMTKLRKLCLSCPQLLQIENSVREFQHLSYIRLFNCGMLKQLPALHIIPSLNHLDIVACPNIEKLP